MICEEMIGKMALDMKILPYDNENYESFCNRVLFSSLGVWCNKIAQEGELQLLTSNDGYSRISKAYLTRRINELVENYINIFPFLKNEDENGYFDNIDIPVYIRSVYENLGNFICDGEKRYLRLANYNRILPTDDVEGIYFGEYNLCDKVIGLGNYKVNKPSFQSATLNDIFLISKNAEAYVTSILDNDKFLNYSGNDNNIEFLSNHYNPSLNYIGAWSNECLNGLSIARSKDAPVYYLADKYQEDIRLYDLGKYIGNGQLKYELNRILYGLRAINRFPQRVYYNNIDNNYFSIKLTTDLPYGESLLLFLLGWPMNQARNRFQFLIPRSNYEIVARLLDRVNAEIVEDRND